MILMKTGLWLLIAVVVVAVVFWAWPSGNTGTLRLQITDAPSSLNIEKALVTLSDIEVHKVESDANNANETIGNETNFTTDWFVVVQGPLTYDLINITDIKELLGSKDLEAGKYTQVRLNVESAVVTIDGKEYNLSIPSNSIKLIHPFTIETNKTTTLTLDFDANKSILKTGNNVYELQPVIKIIQE